MLNILITGSNGFVGSRLCRIVAEKGYPVRAVARHYIELDQNVFLDTVVVNDIGSSTDWSSVLKEIDVIIHLAARVHVMKEALKDPLAEYRRTNVEGTRNLALMAVQSGVKRLVYVSTIKVNGESSGTEPFSEKDIPSPQDAYSISKWEAEEVLRDISSRTGLEIVTIRPPLVYGPGVKGNMLSLMQHIDRGRPLPFGNINNRRSFIALDNLVDVLVLAATRTECAGRTFLVSDGDDLSTPDLIRKIALAMRKEAKLINFPGWAFSFASKIVPAMRTISNRLTGSLVIDSTKFREELKWIPPQTVDEGIRAMVSEYLRRKDAECRLNVHST